MHMPLEISLTYILCNFRGPNLDSGSFKADETSIRHLASQVNITFEELLRGATSLGGFIQDNGFVAVPSPNNPGPNGDRYFRLNSIL